MQKIFKPTVFVLAFSALFSLARGQASVSGRITDGSGAPLPGAAVVLTELQRGDVTDASGNFSFSDLKGGSYRLEVSFIGYQKQEAELELTANESKNLRLVLKEDSEEMAEVQVIAKSEVALKREKSFNIAVLDAKELHNLSMDVNQAMGKISGIKIRQEGGLGSDFRFSLNGFTGNQVRFFMDGIPMDHFGSSLSLNNFPVNLIDQIEVYKGVVPVHLGGDALGGAVNIITNKGARSFLDASYSLGSFNTHRASVAGKFLDKPTGLVVYMNSFFNYSDNNYKIDVEIPNENGTIDGTTEVERFHDAYRSAGLRLEAGLQNKSFADELLFGFFASENYKEVQHGYVVRNAFGQVHSAGNTIMPTFRYSKKNLFLEGLSVNAFVSYNLSKNQTVDTASRSYDWYGNFTVNDSKEQGELSNFRKSLFYYDDNSALATLNAQYQLLDNHSLSFNYVYSSFSRVGKDPVAIYRIPFEEPNTVDKNILGLSYDLRLWDDRFKGSVFVKEFLMSAQTIDAAYGEYEKLSADFRGEGFGIATSFYLTPDLLLKASFENTYRLPTAREFFGNGLLMQSNASLEPEKSKNANLGLNFSNQLSKHYFNAEAGLIYRKATDFIRYRTNGITGAYENLMDVSVKGIDGQLRYRFDDLFTAGFNLTYQDMRAGNGDRVPNEPFLFGNADLGFFFRNILENNDRLSINWNTHYVAPFYLFWPRYGGIKYDIPPQLVQGAGITYSFKNNTYNISLECSNISNRKVYDNYGLQKPGRAFFVKLRYHFRQK